MNIIAAVDENWGIGYQGGLLVRIPADMKNFREKTLGRVVVYGRKTLLTFPGGKPLQGRRNLILSKSPGFAPEGAAVSESVPAALELLKGYSPEDIYIIGGESIYREFLPYCNTAYITKIHKSFTCDAFLENLHKDSRWHLTQKGEPMAFEDITFSFDVYSRR